MKTKTKWLNIGLSKNGGWSPRLESNQYPTLRRHVHYPLCYGEDAAKIIAEAGGGSHYFCVKRPSLFIQDAAGFQFAVQ